MQTRYIDPFVLLEIFEPKNVKMVPKYHNQYNAMKHEYDKLTIIHGL